MGERNLLIVMEKILSELSTFEVVGGAILAAVGIVCWYNLVDALREMRKEHGEDQFKRYE